MADPKLHSSLRIDTLAAILDQKLENEAAILDLLVGALARGQTHDTHWARLAEAAQRDDRLAELAFAYERLANDKRVKSLAPASQAVVLRNVGLFFCDVFSDPEGAAGYFERAFPLAPGDALVFEKYSHILRAKGELAKLADLYVTFALHHPDRGDQLRVLREGLGLVKTHAEASVRLGQEILKLAPSDDQTRKTLAARFESLGRLADLARLLEQGLLQSPSAEEEADGIRLRLVSLYSGGLGEIERALPHAEGLLRRTPKHEAARRVLEQLLGHKALTARVAGSLALAHEAAGELADAARYMAMEMESLRGPKRIEVQKRLAVLTLDKLGDSEKAFSLNEAIVPLDPADHDLRARFVKLATALDKQLDATRTLTRASTGSKDPAVRARITADLGDLYREVGDGKKARGAYQTVVDGNCDPAATLHAARALAAICRDPRDPKALLPVLTRLSELSPDTEVRLAVTLEVARLAEDELRDPVAATRAYERLLGTGLEGEALDALVRLYEDAQSYADLVRVLDRQVAKVQETDPARARDIAFRAADLRTTQLDDRGLALSAWQAWVATHGPSPESLSRLLPLLEQERRWGELATLLAEQAATAPKADRPALLARLGQLKLVRLGDAASALAVFREALALEPTERQSRSAVDRMLASGDMRLAAADVLEPIARAEGAAPVLARVLEVRATLTENPDERRRALGEAVELAHRVLRDPIRAVSLAGRGLVDALGTAPLEVPLWIDRVEEVSAGSGDLVRRASVLRDALADRPIEGEALGILARRTGEALVASGDLPGALSVFRRALSFEPSSNDLLSRVDTLLREQGTPDERCALYRSALDLPASPERRRELLHAIAVIERRDLGLPEAAIATYRTALAEQVTDRAAFNALLELYEETGAFEDLYVELDRALATANADERGPLVLRLAVIAEQQGALDRAAIHYAEIASCEGVVAESVLIAAERVARAQDDVKLLHAVFAKRVLSAVDSEDEITWLSRLGDLAVSRLGDPAGAAAAYRQAATIAEANGEGARAAELYERVLGVLPGDGGAAEKLQKLYQDAGAWDRLPAIFSVLLGGAADPIVASRTLLAFEPVAIRAGAIDHFIAEADALLNRGDALGPEAGTVIRLAKARVLSLFPERFAEAAAAYRALMLADKDPPDVSITAFEALLAGRGVEVTSDRRWLFEYRAEHATDEDRIGVLLAWAHAEETILGDPLAAASLYARVIAYDPEHDAALAARSRLLLAQGDVDGAVAVIERRRAQREGSARVPLDLELAGLLLDRLGRPDEALSVIASLLEESPGDPTVLGLISRALAYPSARKGAADLIERAATTAEDPEVFALLMKVLLSTSPVDAELRDARRRWFQRLLDRPGVAAEGALEIAIRGASELPHDLELWARAEGLAREINSPARLAQAYRRALGVRAPGSAPAPALAEGNPIEASAPTLLGLDPDLVEEVGRRAVEFHEEWFEEPETVVALLHRIFELVPASTWAFERLKLTFNLAERWADLFALFDAAIARACDVATRRELLEDAALTAKDLAGDGERAMGYYEAIYAIRPDPRTRASLERLYERNGRNQALIDLLSVGLSGLGGESAQKVRARIAGLWLEGVGDSPRAMEVIEAILAEDASNPDAHELLERVIARPASASPEARRARHQAAARLEDRYRSEGRPVELARVLELDLDPEPTSAERAVRLRTLVRLRLEALGDEPGAFEDLAVLLAIEPDVVDHRVEIMRLAERLGLFARLAEVLATVALTAAAPTRLDLLALSAEIYGERLNDVARAVELHRFILDAADSPSAAALSAARKLDRLLDTEDHRAERCEVLARLADLEVERSARKVARAELARLATAIGDMDRAIGAYEAAALEDPADDLAQAALAAALESVGRWEDLVIVLSRRATRPDLVRVARLLQDPLRDAGRAIDAWFLTRERYGVNAETTTALADLLGHENRFAELVALLESDAMAAHDADRAAELWCQVGDVHRAHTGKLDEAVAAYDLSLEQRPGDQGARRGLEAVLAAHGAMQSLDAVTAERTLASVVTSLSRIYAAEGAYEGTIGLLEARLSAAKRDSERVAILIETANLCEVRAGDMGAAFEALFRAFRIEPSDAITPDLMRLAEAADRWEVLVEALPAELDTRPDLPASVARELWWKAALFHRDRRHDLPAAEIAFERALSRDPSNTVMLEALADVQRASPGRPLVATLLRLADVAARSLDRMREAVVVAEGPLQDASLARSLAEQMLDAAESLWAEGTGVSPSQGPALADGRGDVQEAATWALDTLVRLAHDAGPTAMAELYLRGARLPYGDGERRRLRLCAAEQLPTEVSVGIYEELFEQDPNDEVVSERLGSIYQQLDRRPALVALRERQIAVACTVERRVELRLQMATLLADGGDHEAAIIALKEALASSPTHAPASSLLAHLLEAHGRSAELVALWEERAAELERTGDSEGAAILWSKAAVLAEDKLVDDDRAIRGHRRAAALGARASEEALARLLAGAGDQAGAAEVLERICDRCTPEALAGFALRLADAYLSTGLQQAARTRLERAAGIAVPSDEIRARLAALYREAGEWGALATLIAEDALRISDPAARALLLLEAAALHIDRQHDPAAAIPLLQGAADLVPEDLAVRLKLASARRATSDLEGAEAILRTMIAAFGMRRPKDRAVVHLELARVALAREDREGALLELDAALRIDTAHPEILHLLARLAFEAGQLDRAARTYRSLLLVLRRSKGEEAAQSQGLTRAEVLVELSEIARLTGDADRAEEHLESAIEVARESSFEHDRLLMALRARERHDVLARLLESRLALVSGSSAAEVLEELAGIYETHLGRLADAFDARLSVLAVCLDLAGALDRAVDLARRLAQVDRFITALSGLLARETAPARAIALRVALGRTLQLDRGDDRAAAAVLLEAEQLASESLRARLPDIWRALAEVHERLGDRSAQEALLERRIAAGEAFQGKAEIADALYQLAAVRLSQEGSVVAAVALLDRAQVIAPDIDRAEGMLRQALARDPSQGDVARALEALARRAGRDRALVDALVALSAIQGTDAESAAGDDLPDLLREAVQVAERIGEGPLVEGLLRRVLLRAEVQGEASVGWALIALAEHRVQAGDVAEAADLKQRAARSAGPETERSLLLEVAAMADGPLADLPRAARLYEELRAREPAERDIWQPLADVYRRLGDRARLGALLEETAPLVEGTAERGRLRVERAKMAVDEDPEKAIALLTEVVEEDPSDAEHAGVLRALLEKLGRKDQLAVLFRRQLDAAKDREDKVAVGLLSLRLGGLLETEWDEAGALDVYRGALDWDPKNAEILRQIVRLGTTFEDVEAALDQLLVMEQGDAAVDLALRLADLRAQHGDEEGASEALEKGYAACPTSGRLREELVSRCTASAAWPRLAAVYVRDAEARTEKTDRIHDLRAAATLLRDRAGDPAAAASILERALAEDPSEREVLVALVEAYDSMGSQERGIEALGRALVATPNDPWLYSSRATIHDALGRRQAALEDLECAYEKSGGGYALPLIAHLAAVVEACAAAEGTDEARATARTHRLRLAEVLRRSGNTSRAHAELTELLRIDGRDLAALRGLCALEEGAASWDTAIALLAQMLSMEEGTALVETALRLAAACDHAGRSGDARGALERALRVEPTNPAVRARLRDVYMSLGEGRELAGLVLEDAAHTTDAAARFALLVQGGRLLLASEGSSETVRAVAVLEEANTLVPEDSDVSLLLADAYAQQGRTPEARGVLDGVVASQRGRRTKSLSGVYRRISRLDLTIGDRSSALAALTRAFECDAQSAETALDLGTLAIALNEKDLATRAFRAITLMKVLGPSSTDGATITLRAVAYLELAKIALLEGDRRKARLLCDKAVIDDPGLDAARALLEQLKAG